ncbi:hypothetical protein A8C32_02800 [Flavivirga aquatica]|uniref:Uncharacterized protein n=1 Tax=Flavivirga aquatica TaxID=1849968 RepID=A0A1E5TAR5_9FLAO|nr:DUF4738 domain-containing protein [Flavivirga aquatica]OEK08397.1 hypothetical protein A8C32_02800 [Flavivirga aquatica]
MIFLLLATSLISCDGRNRAYKSNQDILRESNLLSAFSEQVKFVPEQHIEINTDTILNNGFEIKIKYNSTKNNIVLKTIKTKNDTIIKVYYKNFEANLQVFKNGNQINKSIIDKKVFKEFETPSFWANAIMQFIWIDHYASNENMLYLNTSFCLPNTDRCKDFTLEINKQGVIKITEKQLLANSI